MVQNRGSRILVSLNLEPYESGENGCERMILLRSILFCWRSLKFASAMSLVSLNLNGGFIGVSDWQFVILLIWLSQVGLELLAVPCDTLPLFGW